MVRIHFFDAPPYEPPETADEPMSSAPNAEADDLADRLAAIRPVSAPYGGLPPGVLIHVVEELIALRGPHAQHDIAALRLASKLLCSVATPSFYKVIQIYDGKHILDLISQVQNRPELCNTTRAIWWDDSISIMGTLLETSRPHLVHFPALEELAYCYDMHYVIPSAAHGIQYAIREIGPWCGAPDPTRNHVYTYAIQGTPTIKVNSGATRAEVLEQCSEPNFKHAIWAAHFVCPWLNEESITLARAPGTVTHLTVTLWVHPGIPPMHELAKHLKEFLHRCTMPMLKFLVVRLISFGKRPNGLPTAEDAQGYRPFPRPENRESLYYQDQAHFAFIENSIAEIVKSFRDDRIRFETIKLTGVQSQTRYEDVRKFTRQQWMERVNGGAGPWLDPMTQETKLVAPQEEMDEID